MSEHPVAVQMRQIATNARAQSQFAWNAEDIGIKNRYAGNILFCVTVNGNTQGFVCAPDSEYMRLMTQKAKGMYSDEFLINPSIWEHYLM